MLLRCPGSGFLSTPVDGAGEPVWEAVSPWSRYRIVSKEQTQAEWEAELMAAGWREWGGPRPMTWQLWHGEVCVLEWPVGVEGMGERSLQLELQVAVAFLQYHGWCGVPEGSRWARGQLWLESLWKELQREWPWKWPGWALDLWAAAVYGVPSDRAFMQAMGGPERVSVAGGMPLSGGMGVGGYGAGVAASVKRPRGANNAAGASYTAPRGVWGTEGF